MSRNPILDELHAARQKLLGDAGGDVHRYVEEARQRALASGRVIAKRKQRTSQRTAAAKSAVSEVDNRSSPPGDR
jgi:cell division septum initiation protein DivIVA